MSYCGHAQHIVSWPHRSLSNVLDGEGGWQKALRTNRVIAMSQGGLLKTVKQVGVKPRFRRFKHQTTGVRPRCCAMAIRVDTCTLNSPAAFMMPRNTRAIDPQYPPTALGMREQVHRFGYFDNVDDPAQQCLSGRRLILSHSDFRP